MGTYEWLFAYQSLESRCCEFQLIGGAIPSTLLLTVCSLR